MGENHCHCGVNVFYCWCFLFMNSKKKVISSPADEVTKGFYFFKIADNNPWLL